MPTINRTDVARAPSRRRPVHPVYLPAERAGSSALLAHLGLRGDAAPRLRLGVDSSDLPGLIFGSGAAQDLRAYRAAASTLVVDNAAGAAATLRVVGQADMAAEAAPATPASGYGRVYFNTSDKHFHQIDDAGVDTDLAQAGGAVTVKTASIPFTDGDTSRVVTITDAAVLVTSKILGTIKRPNTVLSNGIVQSISGVSNSGTSLVLTLGSPTTPGNQLILFAATKAVAATLTVAGAHDTLLTTDDNVTTGVHVWMRNKGNITGGDTAFTVTLGSSDAVAAWLVEVVGVTAADNNNGAIGTSNPNSASILTNTADDFLIAGAAWRVSTTTHTAVTDPLDAVALTSLADVVTSTGTNDVRLAVAYGTAGIGASQIAWTTSPATTFYAVCGESLKFGAVTLPNYEYLYPFNVIDVRAGSFDVEISATAMGFEEPSVAPNETVTLDYVIG